LFYFTSFHSLPPGTNYEKSAPMDIPVPVQVIAWKTRLRISEMTYYVSIGTVWRKKSTHSPNLSLRDAVVDFQNPDTNRQAQAQSHFKELLKTFVFMWRIFMADAHVVMSAVQFLVDAKNCENWLRV